MKSKFLEAFRRHGNVSWAARESGVPHRTLVYKWRDDDAEFAQEFASAEIDATETLEAEAFRRGHDGVEEPVFHQGEICGAVKKYSDTLLIVMLKARAPEKYRERYDMKHGGKVDHNVTMDAAKSVLRVTGGTGE